MKEVWKPIEGWRGYEVSNLGRVRSYHFSGYGLRQRTRPKLRRPVISTRTGYPMVYLYQRGGGVPRNVAIHTLVLEAFVSQRPLGLVARHLDGSRDNNKLSNLVWGTMTENQVDRIAHGTDCRGEKNSQSKLTGADVQRIRLLSKQGRSSRSVARQFGVEKTTVMRVRSRQTWSHL